MIVDTGILYALVDRSDRHHQEALEIFRRQEVKVIPEPVVVETDWLILERLGVDVEIRFLQGLASRATVVECPTDSDRRRAAELVAQYRDLELGYVDAVVMALAERLGETTVATVDLRHFRAVRPRHVASFDLLPG